MYCRDILLKNLSKFTHIHCATLSLVGSQFILINLFIPTWTFLSRFKQYLIYFGMFGSSLTIFCFTLFDMGGGHDGPQNVFDHCAHTLRRRKLKLCDFLNTDLWSIKKSYFWFPRLSGVAIATSLSGSTRDFVKLSLHMFPYNEILKVFKSKI